MPEVRLINTSRGTFNVRSYGVTTDPPIFLLHGWPQTSYCWHELAQYLEDYHVIAPDLRGMGESNRALELEHYTKDEMAEDIFAIADELGIESFYLAGHDWGGAIVQEMAFLAPLRIDKLIIINMVILNNTVGLEKGKQKMITQMYRSSWYQFFMSVPLFPEALLKGKEDVWIRFFSRGIHRPISEEAIQEYIRCYKIENTITTAANLYRTFSKDRKRWESFKGRHISIPTLIIHGASDPVIIDDYLVGVEECYESVKVQSIAGGHFICDEQPQEVADSIRAFLRE